jgi:hypothetical protein
MSKSASESRPEVQKSFLLPLPRVSRYQRLAAAELAAVMQVARVRSAAQERKGGPDDLGPRV